MVFREFQFQKFADHRIPVLCIWKRNCLWGKAILVSSVIAILPADDLAPVGANTSADKVMTNHGPCCILDWRRHCVISHIIIAMAQFVAFSLNKNNRGLGNIAYLPNTHIIRKSREIPFSHNLFYRYPISYHNDFSHSDEQTEHLILAHEL